MVSCSQLQVAKLAQMCPAALSGAHPAAPSGNPSQNSGQYPGQNPGQNPDQNPANPANPGLVSYLLLLLLYYGSSLAYNIFLT